MADAKLKKGQPGSRRVMGIVRRLEPLAKANATAASHELRDLAEVSLAIGAVRPNDFARHRIPRARAELESLSREVEDATDRILAFAERLQGLQADAPQGGVAHDAIELFEACGFRDLVGQRLTHVLRMLDELGAKLEDISHRLQVTDAEHVETPDEERRRRLLCNGPGLNGPAVNQARVDAMMQSAWPDALD